MWPSMEMAMSLAPSSHSIPGAATPSSILECIKRAEDVTSAVRSIIGHVRDPTSTEYEPYDAAMPLTVPTPSTA